MKIVLIGMNILGEILLLGILSYYQLGFPVILLGIFVLLYHVKRFNKFLKMDVYLYWGDMLSVDDYKKRNMLMDCNDKSSPGVLFHLLTFIILFVISGIILFFDKILELVRF